MRRASSWRRGCAVDAEAPTLPQHGVMVSPRSLKRRCHACAVPIERITIVAYSDYVCVVLHRAGASTATPVSDAVA